jgi:hypothetical protein
MRMPWQRRSAERRVPAGASATEPIARESTQTAWRSLAPLQGSIGVRPPLTAQSAELAEGLSRRLRSPSERAPLVHRSGLPEPAAAGMVRGIATPAVASHRIPPQRIRSHEDGVDPDDTSTVDGGAVAPAPALVRVPARRPMTGSLTAVDPDLAAAVREARGARITTRVDDESLGAGEESTPAPEPLAPTHGLQRTVVRQRMSRGGPRPLGLQAPIAHEPVRVEDRRPAPDAVNDPPPERPSLSVAAAVGWLHAADVSDVQIERGVEADRLAASAQARAVTRSGEVFIPAAAGRLDSGRGGGLLAHELTHAIQQRRLGSSVPLEHSPKGRRLEAEAAMTERQVRGDLGAPAPPPAAAEPATPAPAPPPPSEAAPVQDDAAAAARSREIQEELVASGRAIRMADGSLVFPGAGGHLREQRPSPAQASAPMQRAPDEAAAPDTPVSAEPRPEGQPTTSPPAAPGDQVQRITPPARLHIAPPPSVGVAAPSSPASVTMPESASQPGVGSAAPETAAAAPVDIPPAAVQPTAPNDETVPALDFDEIARRVYGQVRTQLRSELLIDRERAGLLTDFR